MARVRRLFTTSGFWICPAGVTWVMITARPGAGGGAGSTAGLPGGVTSSGPGGGTGGPGAGCQSVTVRVPTVPGTSYPITIGVGGAGGAGGVLSADTGVAGQAGSFTEVVGLVKVGRTEAALGAAGGVIRLLQPAGNAAGTTQPNPPHAHYNPRMGPVGLSNSGGGGSSGNNSGNGQATGIAGVINTLSSRSKTVFPAVPSSTSGLNIGSKPGGGAGGPGGMSTGDEHAMFGVPVSLTHTGGAGANGGNGGGAGMGVAGANGGNGLTGTNGRGGGSGGAGGGGGAGTAGGGAGGTGGSGGAGSDGIVLVEYEV